MPRKKKVVDTSKASGSVTMTPKRRADTAQTTNMDVDPKTRSPSIMAVDPKTRSPSIMDVDRTPMSINTRRNSLMSIGSAKYLANYREPRKHYSTSSTPYNGAKTPGILKSPTDKSKPGRSKGVLRELSAQFARLATSDSANNAQVKAYTDETYRRYILNKSRANYITKLKNKIYKGERGGEQNHELLSGKPALKTAIENAATRNANNLFLFPDTDPLVYRRQINIPNVTSHSPIFGF